MNLFEIEKQANNIKKYSELLIIHYRNIVKILTNFYNIFSNYDFLIAKKLTELIDRYNEMIDFVSQNYSDNADQILIYVENSSQNLDNLTKDVVNSIKIFNDSRLNNDDIEIL